MLGFGGAARGLRFTASSVVRVFTRRGGLSIAVGEYSADASGALCVFGRGGSRWV